MIQATNNFVFIVKDKSETEKAGLIIPSEGREKPHSGIIYSIGSMVQDKRIKSGKGKKCLFHKGTGFTIEFEGAEYLVLEGERIIGIV